MVIDGEGSSVGSQRHVLTYSVTYPTTKAVIKNRFLPVKWLVMGNPKDERLQKHIRDNAGEMMIVSIDLIHAESNVPLVGWIVSAPRFKKSEFNLPVTTDMTFYGKAKFYLAFSYRGSDNQFYPFGQSSHFVVDDPAKSTRFIDAEVDIATKNHKLKL